MRLQVHQGVRTSGPHGQWNKDTRGKDGGGCLVSCTEAERLQPLLISQ